jgi:hypothetical protein
MSLPLQDCNWDSIPVCALFDLADSLNPVALYFVCLLLQSSGVFGVAEGKVLKRNVCLENILVV